jgi:hypothetical protein
VGEMQDDFKTRTDTGIPDTVLTCRQMIYGAMNYPKE